MAIIGGIYIGRVLYFSKSTKKECIFLKKFTEVWKKVPSEIKEVFLRQLGIEHKLV